MNIQSKFGRFLSRHLPFPPSVICLLGLSLFFFGPFMKLFNTAQFIMLHSLLLLNCGAYVFLKYKRYKLKIRKYELEEFLTFLENQFPQYIFNGDLYYEEVFDKKNTFQYTELFLNLSSDYRACIEELNIPNLEFLPLHLKQY